MSSLMACIAGMALDAVFGDPVWLYHPVRIIGNWISILEKWLRGFCKNEEKNILKWYESMKEADDIYVLDTGSTVSRT